MKLIPIEKDNSVAEALKSVLSEEDKIDYLVIVAIKKDGTQLLETSRCNAHQKSFALAFFQAWMMKWFRLEDT